jgi:hypothetical protein
MDITIVAIITLNMTVIPLMIGGIVIAAIITTIPVPTTTTGVDIEQAARSANFQLFAIAKLRKDPALRQFVRVSTGRCAVGTRPGRQHG